MASLTKDDERFARSHGHRWSVGIRHLFPDRGGVGNGVLKEINPLAPSLSSEISGNTVVMLTDAATLPKPLVSVCVCTYQRPTELKKLLECLERQVTNGLFKLSIVVVDNDARETARNIVESLAERSKIPIAYKVEPRQNIALARNASVAMAMGDLVAFVDDDEEPSSDWLCKLYQTLVEYAADGVLGPVYPKFDEGAPSWAVKGQVFQRPTFETGKIIHWNISGTGNVLVKRDVLLEFDGPFNPHLGVGGEDTDFFRRAMSRGRIFRWSADAVCYERVPPERTQVAFQLRRALLRGKLALRGPGGGWRGILRSAIAVTIYTLVLPVCLMMGSHVFVTYLVKSFDHLGKLLASCGLDLVGDKYIT
jgi:succinoglycan biosynthesis protein ExoM